MRSVKEVREMLQARLTGKANIVVEVKENDACRIMALILEEMGPGDFEASYDGEWLRFRAEHPDFGECPPCLDLDRITQIIRIYTTGMGRFTPHLFTEDPRRGKALCCNSHKGGGHNCKKRFA